MSNKQTGVAGNSFMFFFVIADKLLYLLIDRLRHSFTSLDKGFRDVVRFLVDYRSSRASHPIDGRYDYSYALQYFRNCSFLAFSNFARIPECSRLNIICKMAAVDPFTQVGRLTFVRCLFSRDTMLIS